MPRISPTFACIATPSFPLTSVAEQQRLRARAESALISAALPRARDLIASLPAMDAPRLLAGRRGVSAPPAWSPDSINSLRRFVEAGLSGEEIAARLGRTTGAVYQKARQIGLTLRVKA